MRKILAMFIVMLLTNRTAYAKEVTLVNHATFMESIDETESEYQYESIIEVKDVLIGEFVLTAYCPCSICCGSYSNPSCPKTASGTIAQANHTIAADTDILPFGTEVVIDGQTYIVEDVGGGVNGNHIDVFFNTHSEALSFGRKVEKVYRQEEVKTVFKSVEFREYMMITGDLMKRKIAEHYYDKVTGNVTWKNGKGDIVATRMKNVNGVYEHKIEENIYKEWKRSR